MNTPVASKKTIFQKDIIEVKSLSGWFSQAKPAATQGANKLP
jgi:hypothetical protein